MPISSAARRRLLAAFVLTPVVALARNAFAQAVIGRALARRVLVRSATSRAASSQFAKPVDIYIRRSQYPAAASHIEHAQRDLGAPSVLTLDRAGAVARRHESLHGVGKNGARPGRAFDRDEYPPALTKEGGSGASVNFIGSHDNRGAGHAIASQVRGLPDGTRIRVLVAD
jgi:hypothetical protein